MHQSTSNYYIDKTMQKHIVRALIKFQKKYRKFDVCFMSFTELFSFLSGKEIDTLLEVCKLSSSSVNQSIVYQDRYIAPYPDIKNARFRRVQEDEWNSFRELNLAIKNICGASIYIMSGYRSPAYQSMLWLKYLFDNEYKVSLSNISVQLPLKSEHGMQPYHAIDVSMAPDHFKLDKKLIKILEDNVSNFGFSISYPKLNNKGIIYEPWHLMYNRSVNKVTKG